jgi:hypothetical protein
VSWLYAEAATAPIHERDIAAVAVRALCDEGHHAKEYVLTGPQSLTQREEVRILAMPSAGRCATRELSREDARRRCWPWCRAGGGHAVGRVRRRGRPAAFVTSTVADVTGTPARSFRDWAIETRLRLPLASDRVPELPEVEVTRRQIARLLVGRRIARVVTTEQSYFFLTRPALLKRRLRGRASSGSIVTAST